MSETTLLWILGIIVTLGVAVLGFVFTFIRNSIEDLRKEIERTRITHETEIKDLKRDNEQLWQRVNANSIELIKMESLKKDLGEIKALLADHIKFHKEQDAVIRNFYMTFLPALDWAKAQQEKTNK